MADEWVVVGRSGKAKNGSKKGNIHVAQQPSQAQGYEDPALPSAVPAAVAPLLPGWEAGSDMGCASQPSAHAKPRRGRHRILERTTEELATDLKQQVQQCRSDIEGSSIFASLRQAFLAGAPHLPFQVQNPPSLPSTVWSMNVSQQEPSPDHSSQQLLQHQQEHQQGHSEKELHSDQQPPLRQQHSHSHAPQLEQRQRQQQQKPQQQEQKQQEQRQQEQRQQQQQQQPEQGELYLYDGERQGFSAPHQHGWHLIKELVIFGLGSMQTSSTSRYQLAMASLLATKMLPGLQAPPMAFDPAFTPADVALLQLMGISVISNNQLCAHRAHVPTFFYLPHLEGRLCDNLLAANSSSTNSASHPSTAHSPGDSCSKDVPPQDRVCTQADGSSVPSAQGACIIGTLAPNSTNKGAAETPSGMMRGRCAEPCTAAECSSNSRGSVQGTCTHHPHQHTLHNCVLLANRFSTYEGRAPGPVGSSAGEGRRCHRHKQGGGGGKGGKRYGNAERVQQGNGAGDAAQGDLGGLEALLAHGQPATMVSLVSAGAVLELQVKEDRHFPSPSAFNDMALHIIP